MEQTNATTNASLTEYLSTADDGDELDEDPDEYFVECICGEEFGSWDTAIRHVADQ
jgi:hypothetical protein